MSNLRPDFHVAQQSRRDKLRIHQHHPNSPNYHHHHHFQNYEIPNFEPSTSRNICYDPASVICTEMLDFSPNQEPEKRDTNLYRETHTIFNPSAPVVSTSDFGTWKSVASSHSTTTDWVNANQNPIFVETTLPNASCGEISVPNCSSSAHYQNALQELITSSNANRSFGLELATLRQKNSEQITSHANYYDNQWNGAMDYTTAKNTCLNYHSDKQALSLSLSSVPSPKVHTTTHIAIDSQSRDVCTTIGIQDPMTWNPNLVNARQGMMTGAQASSIRNLGPLGPFTGYATILRSSRFLRPAEQLLDELCCIARPKNVDNSLNDVRVSVSNVDADLGGSSFEFDGSKDVGRETGGASCSTDFYPPGNLQKKAKLMYMQDEVCKRYKQYHQQIQMVVSSFESVSGLSSATPYVGLALKMVSKHFRCLKNAITHQLKSITSNALGEELSSPCGDTSSIKLKFFDQSLQKQKGASNNSISILESQHIWRPQRGLPERAVSILRAWLFDHFLHPYPTDTDKHMLARQTGLTRNQVSNWFINARVRVWKPMVEEIHMLETKGVAEGGGLLTNSNGKTAINQSCDQANYDASQSTNRLSMISPHKQVECSSEQEYANVWNQEKRSRIEYHHRVVPGVHGSLVGMGPSHRSGVEMGSVSLTLGLRQSAEINGQRSYFGGQIIRDFVG